MSEKVLEGFVVADPDDGASPVAPPDAGRPPAEYGHRGIAVKMTPVDGLTKLGLFEREKPFAFQCPPTMEEFGEDGAANHADYGTVSAGQHSTYVGRELRTCEFETMFLDWKPVWSLLRNANWTPDPQKMVQELCEIRDSGTPFLLTCHQQGRQRYDINYVATLRSVSWRVHAGEDDCYYVSLRFTEFASPDVKEFLAHGSQHPKLPATLNTAHLPTNRNTLAKMAKFYYGDPSKWKEIATANGIKKVGPNVTLTPKNTGRSKITVPKPKGSSKNRARTHA